ncbi:hypothetical protein [Winogradskyella sp. PC D3.3]
MRKKKAIKILEEQKQKILSSDHPNNQEWTFETASYIKDFFGFDSTEYAWIAQFKWHVKTLSTDFVSDKEVKEMLDEKPKKVIQFLDNCKRTLNNKGIFKKPKSNFLSDKTNFELVGIIFGICVFVFWIGYWTKKFEVFSVATQSEKSISLPAVNSTENVSDEKDKVTESENSKNE